MICSRRIDLESFSVLRESLTREIKVVSFPKLFLTFLLGKFMILGKLYEWVVTPLKRPLRVTQFICSTASEWININENVDY